MHPSSKQEMTQQIRAMEGKFRGWRRNIFALLTTRAEWLKIFTLNWKDWLTVAEWLVFNVKDLICTIDNTKTYAAWELLSSGLLRRRRSSHLLRDESLEPRVITLRTQCGHKLLFFEFSYVCIAAIKSGNAVEFNGRNISYICYGFVWCVVFNVNN